MVVKVKVAVPYADKVKAEEVLAPIPFGNKSLEVVEGGLVAEGMTIPELGDAGPEIYYGQCGCDCLGGGLRWAVR